MIVLKKGKEKPEYIIEKCSNCGAKLLIGKEEYKETYVMLFGKIFAFNCKCCNEENRIRSFRESLLTQKIKRFLYKRKMEKHNETSL